MSHKHLLAVSATELTRLTEQNERLKKEIPKAHLKLADKIVEITQKLGWPIILLLGIYRLVH